MSEFDSMRDIAISVEGLSKQYSIRGQRERYRTLRDSLSDKVAAPFRALRSAFRRSPAAEAQEDGRFLALRDIYFEVERGEVVGVIGRNGAGKSTLLKILSRITEPTEGEARIYGRVGSLLEVGTGFHQELTGRENIHLNGAILGMKRSEINRKFEEIVEFAEVSKFIDTPVKHYSSGMYLRLAFAVAAHLETEILFVDEVLAVGDLAFQNKCLGKMRDVASEGRTILFVSHNLAAVKELCTTSIVLKEGLLDFRGPVVEGLARYVQSFSQDEGEKIVSETGWRSVVVNAELGDIANTIMGDEPLIAEATLDLSEEFMRGRFICIINDSVGATVVHQRMNNLRITSGELKPDRYQVRIEFPPLWLAPGMYTMHFKFIGHKPSGQQERHYSERIILNVVGDIDKLGRATPVLSPPARWTLAPKEMEVEMVSDF